MRRRGSKSKNQGKRPISIIESSIVGLKHQLIRRILFTDFDDKANSWYWKDQTQEVGYRLEENPMFAAGSNYVDDVEKIDVRLFSLEQGGSLLGMPVARCIPEDKRCKPFMFMSSAVGHNLSVIQGTLTYLIIIYLRSLRDLPPNVKNLSTTDYLLDLMGEGKIDTAYGPFRAPSKAELFSMLNDYKSTEGIRSLPKSDRKTMLAWLTGIVQTYENNPWMTRIDNPIFHKMLSRFCSIRDLPHDHAWGWAGWNDVFPGTMFNITTAVQVILAISLRCFDSKSPDNPKIETLDSSYGNADGSEMHSSLCRWEYSGSRVVYVNNEVVGPFLDTTPPVSQFKVLPPRWGRSSYFQFDWPEDRELPVKKMKPSSFYSESSTGWAPNTLPLKKATVDGMLVWYVPNGLTMEFPSPEDESKALDECFDCGVETRHYSGDITVDEYWVEKMAIFEKHGGMKVEGPIYETTFCVNVEYKDEDIQDTKVWQKATFFDGYDPNKNFINPDWGRAINKTLGTLAMNLFYALNRTHIITVTKMAGKKKRQSNSSKKRGEKPQWSLPPYINLSLDTEFKKTVRYRYVKSDKDKDHSTEPAKKQPGHRRKGTWAAVWILKENMQKWEVPDGRRVHESTGRTHYRITRWRIGFDVNGGKPGKRSDIKVSKWKPRK